LLTPYLPRGLELDRWQGQPYVSIVGFMFRDTRLRGWAVPGHRTFAELNLRFYVRQSDAPESRGVCFIREVVALPAVTFVARAAYNENYVTCPMRYRHSCTGQRLTDGDRVEYSWKRAGRWNKVAARSVAAPRLAAPESAEEYFTENYWGYTAQRDGGTKKYRVEHPPWLIWPTTEVTWDCDVAAMYGPEWQGVLGGAPESAYLIEGSAIKVYTGKHLEVRCASQDSQPIATS
jgi:uncharacterized protein